MYLKRLTSVVMLIIVVLLNFRVSTAGIDSFTSDDTVSFLDIDGWYREAVEYNASLGIIRGTGMRLFSPNGDMTQAMAVTMLGRLSEIYGKSIEYSGGAYWYSRYAVWAENSLIVPDEELPFIPSATVKREAFAAYLCNTLDYLEIAPPNLPGWNNRENGWKSYNRPMPLQESGNESVNLHSQWSWPSFGGLCESGIFIGYPGNDFVPGAVITRAEACQILMRLCREYLFSDIDEKQTDSMSGTTPDHHDYIGVVVSTVEELLDAIAPNTHITLNAGRYDVSTVAGKYTPYISWLEDIYGHGERTLVIKGIDGLTLEAAPNAIVEIVTPWLYAEVLYFQYCNDISIIGITAGHIVTEIYQCDAGVINFYLCDKVYVDDCVFFGSGTTGIRISNCNNVLIKDTVVTDCSFTAINIHSSNDVEVIYCQLVDNRGYGYVVSAFTSNAVFRNCEISGNRFLWHGVIYVSNGYWGISEVLFDGCTIIDNAPDIATYGSGEYVLIKESQFHVLPMPQVSIKDCEIELGEFSQYWNNAVDLGGNVLK